MAAYVFSAVGFGRHVFFTNSSFSWNIAAPNVKDFTFFFVLSLSAMCSRKKLLRCKCIMQVSRKFRRPYRAFTMNLHCDVIYFCAVSNRRLARLFVCLRFSSAMKWKSHSKHQIDRWAALWNWTLDSIDYPFLVFQSFWARHFTIIASLHPGVKLWVQSVRAELVLVID